MTQSSHHIGFISTRFAGTDGVSLETAKWATVLGRMGHKYFYFAGACDRNANQAHIVPEAFYRHPEIDKLNQQAYSGSWTVTKEARAAHPEIAALHKNFFSIYVRPPAMTRRINELKEYFKAELQPITRASEIMALPEFGAERYAKLKPYVTALPVGTPLNVCTASGIVLDSLSENAREFGLNPEDLGNRRKDACFPTLDDLKGSLGNAAYDKLKNSLTESSGFFRSTVWVTLGTTDFTLYSLLARAGSGLVRPYLRSFGTE